MENKYAVGIDPHKELIVAGLFDLSNRLTPIKYYDLRQDKEDFQKFYTDIISYSTTTPFCMEDIDGVGKQLRKFLQSKNATIFHVPSNYTYQYKRNNPNPEKTDSLDCKYIVQAWLIESEIKQLRLNFDEEKYTELKDIAYERWEAGQAVGHLKRKLNERLYKRLGVNYKKFFTNTIYTKAMIQEAYDMFSEKKDANERIIISLLKDLVRAQEKCTELDPVLKMLSKNKTVQDEIKRLREIKGCGPLIACSLLGEIKSGYKLESGKSLKKWAGISPIEYSTGGKVIHHANTRGHRHLNCLIHQIMNTQINNTKIPSNHLSKVYYLKRRKSGDGELKAKQKVKNAICDEIFRKLHGIGNTLL